MDDIIYKGLGIDYIRNVIGEISKSHHDKLSYHPKPILASLLPFMIRHKKDDRQTY